MRQALELLEEAESYTSCQTWSPSLTDEIRSFVVNTRAMLAAAPKPPAVPGYALVPVEPTPDVARYAADRPHEIRAEGGAARAILIVQDS